MEKKMKKLPSAIVIASASVLAGACSAVPAINYGIPEISQQATAGVGDAVYTFNHVPAHTYDAYAGVAKTSAVGTVIDVRPNIQTLTYSGIANERLVFDYSQVGPLLGSHNATAQYDYEVGSDVTYKGATLTVLKADNLSITYVMTKGFSNEEN